MLNLSNIIEFLLVFVIAFLGAVLNDFYQTMTNQEEEVKIARVLLSATTGAILMFAITNYISSYIDGNMFVLLSFVSGITGFSLFEKFKKIDLICLFWKFIDIMQEDGVIDGESGRDKISRNKKEKDNEDNS